VDERPEQRPADEEEIRRMKDALKTHEQELMRQREATQEEIDKMKEKTKRSS
jgi:hypothetical protein